MTRRPTLLELVDEAAPRIARMGHDAIAAAHAAGHPAYVEDRETGRIVRLDPDGTRHFVDVHSEADRAARREALRAYERALDATRDPARDRTRSLVLDTDEEIEAEAIRIARDVQRDLRD